MRLFLVSSPLLSSVTYLALTKTDRMKAAAIVTGVADSRAGIEEHYSS